MFSPENPLYPAYLQLQEGRRGTWTQHPKGGLTEAILDSYRSMVEAGLSAQLPWEPVERKEHILEYNSADLLPHVA